MKKINLFENKGEIHRKCEELCVFIYFNHKFKFKFNLIK